MSVSYQPIDRAPQIRGKDDVGPRRQFWRDRVDGDTNARALKKLQVDAGISGRQRLVGLHTEPVHQVARKDRLAALRARG